VLLDIMLAGFVGLAIIVTLWSLGVAFSPRTNNTVRKHAMDVFHVAWKTAVVAVLMALIRFYASGLIGPGPIPTAVP
jgi:hypothetical protein